MGSGTNSSSKKLPGRFSEETFPLPVKKSLTMVPIISCSPGPVSEKSNWISMLQLTTQTLFQEGLVLFQCPAILTVKINQDLLPLFLELGMLARIKTHLHPGLPGY